MEFLHKLESTIAGWTKGVPHLPKAGQKWLADNVWWIVLIGAILSGISLLVALGGLLTLIALLGAVTASIYGAYAAAGVTGLTIVAAIIGLAFLIVRVVLLSMAVKPLKALQAKGWMLLFIGWLIEVAAVVISSVMTMSVVSFLLGIIMGAVGLAISGYFLFEIHSHFAHEHKAHKTKAAAKKA